MFGLKGPLAHRGSMCFCLECYDKGKCTVLLEKRTQLILLCKVGRASPKKVAFELSVGTWREAITASICQMSTLLGTLSGAPHILFIITLTFCNVCIISFYKW